jgi:5-methylcytosine-specific restriction endonuclease McrA
MSNYSELLKDPRWQRVRLKILERDKWQCQGCGEKEKTLHVHHKFYQVGFMPWDYNDEILITLCEECHLSEEQRIKENGSVSCAKYLLRVWYEPMLADIMCNFGNQI